MIKYECNEDMVKIDIKGNLVTLLAENKHVLRHAEPVMEPVTDEIIDEHMELIGRAF